MTPERWTQVQQLIREQYQVDDEYTDDLDPGSAHCLEFSTPAAELKVCFIQRPKVLGKKTHYSHRGGGEVNVDYTFSDEESASHLEVSRWNLTSEAWESMQGAQLFH